MLQDFMVLGFGIGLHLLLALGLFENAAYAIFISVRGERKNNTKALLFGTLVISAISFSVGFTLASRGDPHKFSNIPVLALALIWAWYFVIIPQLIIRTILAKIDAKARPNRHLWMTLSRIILTAVIPIGLTLVHHLIGRIFGLPSD